LDLEEVSAPLPDRGSARAAKGAGCNDLDAMRVGLRSVDNRDPVSGGCQHRTRACVDRPGRGAALRV